MSKHALDSKENFYNIENVSEILHSSPHKDLTEIEQDIRQVVGNSYKLPEAKDSSINQKLVKSCNHRQFTPSSNTINDNGAIDDEILACYMLINHNSYVLHLCVIFRLSYRKYRLKPLQTKLDKKLCPLVSTTQAKSLLYLPVQPLTH